jgi:uncharacterized protein
MGKLLFWVVVILVIMFAIRLINHQKGQQRRDDESRPASPPPTNPASVESMVRCEHCGVHLPRSEAVQMNDRLWCSAEHARLGPKKQASRL